MSFTAVSTDVERLVLDRYADAARAPAGLCCPSKNGPKLLAAVPAEILERTVLLGRELLLAMARGILAEVPGAFDTSIRTGTTG